MACLLTAGLTGTTVADVLNMGGTRNPDGSWNGIASLETVPVGNPGNAGELSGEGAGGWGPDRICGAVSYTYNIGKYEVTAGQYCEFLNKVAGADTYGLYQTPMSLTDVGSGITRSGGGTVGNPYTYTVASSHVNRPVNWVSWGNAARFANWLHNGQPTGAQGASTTERGAYTLDGGTSDAALLTVNRNSNWKWAITSEDEWYKAAYHKNDGVTGNYFHFPTSSDTPPEQDMADVSGNNANYWAFPYVSPIDSGKYTTVVGEFQHSESPYGTFDQGGNVFEWNEAVIGSSHGERGGSFGSGYEYYSGDPHAWFRDDLSESLAAGYFFGFRVSEVPEPATLLLALAGAGLVARRRNRNVRSGPA